MKVKIEISNYPLSEDYEPKILDFINRCQAHGMRTKVNATATHIQGDYETVMNLVQEGIKTSFEKYGQMIFVLKVLKGELDLDFSI